MLLLLSLLLKAAPPPISRVRLFNNTHVPNAHLIAAASKVAEAAAASAAFSYATAAATVTVPRAWETDFHEDGGFRIWRRCAFNSIRGDPIDQFVFALLGGRTQSFGIDACDIWSGGCPCSAPLEHIGRGTFVEIGANDGLHMSNSYFFEYYLRWRGLCVEASWTRAQI